MTEGANNIKNDSQRYVCALVDRFTLADDDGVTVVIERLKEGYDKCKK